MMSPLETYAEAKRSGKYHPITEKNWPTEKKVNNGLVLDEPVGAEVILPTPIIKSYGTTSTGETNYHKWIQTIGVLIILILLAFLAFRTTPDHKSVVYKDRVKIKKVYISKSTGKWRKKLCYTYRDWNACLAYKKNLPFVATIGRKDL